MGFGGLANWSHPPGRYCQLPLLLLSLLLQHELLALVLSLSPWVPAPVCQSGGLTAELKGCVLQACLHPPCWRLMP